MMADVSDDEPILPTDIEEVNIEDIVKDTLAKSDKKLSILEQEKIADAVEDFVSKEIKGILGETVDKIIAKQQRRLVSQGNEEDDENMKLTTATAIREEFQSKTKMPVTDISIDWKDQHGTQKSPQKRSQSYSDCSADPSPPRKNARMLTSPKEKKTQNQSKSKRTTEKLKSKISFHPNRTTKRSRTKSFDDDSDVIVDDDSDVEVIQTSSTSRKRLNRTAKSNAKQLYGDNSDDDDDIGTGWGTAGSAR